MPRLLAFFVAAVAACSASVAVAGRCTGSTPCYACTSCSRCKHCKSGGECGACNGGNAGKSRSEEKVPKQRPLEAEPMCNSSRLAVTAPRRPPLDFPPADPFADGPGGELSDQPMERPRAILAPGVRDFPGEGKPDKPPRTTARTKAREVAAKTDGDAEPDPRIREWKGANGEVLACGRYMSLINKTLWVKTREGRKVRLSLDNISEADARYLEDRKWE